MKQGETSLPLGRVKIDGVYLEIGDFRDFVVADAYGGVQGQWGKPPPDQ